VLWDGSDGGWENSTYTEWSTCYLLLRLSRRGTNEKQIVFEMCLRYSWSGRFVLCFSRFYFSSIFKNLNMYGFAQTRRFLLIWPDRKRTKHVDRIVNAPRYHGLRINCLNLTSLLRCLCFYSADWRVVHSQSTFQCQPWGELRNEKEMNTWYITWQFKSYCARSFQIRYIFVFFFVSLF
jgi:hypothetical protein